MGYHDNDMKVKVDRKSLIIQLNENKGKHIRQYKDAYAGFKKSIETELEQKLEAIRGGHSFKLEFENHKPESHENDYDDIIGMLELSVDDNVELNYQQYKQYINDEWDWKRHWQASNAVYMSAQ